MVIVDDKSRSNVKVRRASSIGVTEPMINTPMAIDAINAFARPSNTQVDIARTHIAGIEPCMLMSFAAPRVTAGSESSNNAHSQSMASRPLDIYKFKARMGINSIVTNRKYDETLKHGPAFKHLLFHMNLYGIASVSVLR